MNQVRLVCLGWVVVTFFAVGTMSTAAAQAYAPGAANEVTEFKGTLKGVRGNIVSVTRDDGVDCMVMFPDQITGVEFIAKALPAYLRRGTMVRFATTLGPTGMPLTPVNKLEIIAPVNLTGLNSHSRVKFLPGVNSVERKPPPRNGVMTGKVYVVGNLIMLAPNGGLAVQAGKVPVQTMVAPDATLEIRANSLALAQVGDTVSVAGFYQPPDDTKIKAERITVTSDRIYGEAPPPKERKSRRDRTKLGKESEAAEEKPALGEDDALSEAGAEAEE